MVKTLPKYITGNSAYYIKQIIVKRIISLGTIPGKKEAKGIRYIPH
jgi:hypothetical protein